MTKKYWYTTCTFPDENVNYFSSPDARGTLDILWSCLGILLLCTWSIQRLNVPIQTEVTGGKHWYGRSQWWGRMGQRFYKKAKWMLITVAAPELILGKALADRFSADFQTREMKKWADKDNVSWTVTHSYFANMGGFRVHFDKDLPQNDDEQPSKNENAAQGTEIRDFSVNGPVHNTLPVIAEHSISGPSEVMSPALNSSHVPVSSSSGLGGITSGALHVDTNVRPQISRNISGAESFLSNSTMSPRLISAPASKKYHTRHNGQLCDEASQKIQHWTSILYQSFDATERVPRLPETGKVVSSRFRKTLREILLGQNWLGAGSSKQKNSQGCVEGSPLKSDHSKRCYGLLPQRNHAERQPVDSGRRPASTGEAIQCHRKFTDSHGRPNPRQEQIRLSGQLRSHRPDIVAHRSAYRSRGPPTTCISARDCRLGIFGLLTDHIWVTMVQTERLPVCLSSQGCCISKSGSIDLHCRSWSTSASRSHRRSGMFPHDFHYQRPFVGHQHWISD